MFCFFINKVIKNLINFTKFNFRNYDGTNSPCSHFIMFETNDFNESKHDNDDFITIFYSFKEVKKFKIPKNKK